jgi:hypothetical protein
LICVRSCEEWKASYKAAVKILAKEDVVLQMADGVGLFTQIGNYERLLYCMI